MKFHTDEGTGASAGGRKRILFVDDEELFGYMGSRMLEQQGYRVIYKADSAEALDYFAFHPGAIDLVITGQSLPQMTGAELSRELLKIRPEIPILLCSASATISEEEAKQKGIRGVIPKPLDSTRLADKIRALLDQNPGR